MIDVQPALQFPGSRSELNRFFRRGKWARTDVGSGYGKKLSSLGPEEFVTAKKLILSWNIA